MILAVSGACSRSGKTAAAVSWLQAQPRATALAVKFTTTADVFERCPRGAPCVVCDIAVPFRLIDDLAVLREPGTDTDRLAAGGARRVLWAIAKSSAAAAAWAAVARLLPRDAPVVIEGSTVVGLARPDLTVFVAHPFLDPARWKATSASLVRDAQLVVVNLPAGERRAPSRAVLAELRRWRGGRELRIADVTRPLAEWAPELLSWTAPGAKPAARHEDLARA